MYSNAELADLLKLYSFSFIEEFVSQFNYSHAFSFEGTAVLYDMWLGEDKKLDYIYFLSNHSEIMYRIPSTDCEKITNDFKRFINLKAFL